MKKILLADDHSFVRLGLMQILKDEFPFVSITEVGETESLIKEVIQNDWNLVILDLEMPGRNGLQALEQIRIISPALPVLILTYFAVDVYGLRALQAGASGYMNKNAAPYELIAAIRRIRSGKKYFAPELVEKILNNLNIDKKSHESLSNREFQIFTLLSLGKTISEIAASLSLALTTISTHRGRIMEKLDLSTNSELTRCALANHLIAELYPVV